MAKKEMLKEEWAEMTLEEAKAFRSGLKSPEKPLSQKQKREAFKIYWNQNKKKYGLKNKLEQVLWLHLVSTKNDSPELFEQGIKNFGLKKI